jgi:hypothetical protein
MAGRLLDRAVAEALLSDCVVGCGVTNSAHEAYRRSLSARSAAFLAANDAGLFPQEIADRCRCSVGLVKLEIGKAKKLREESNGSVQPGNAGGA